MKEGKQGLEAKIALELEKFQKDTPALLCKYITMFLCHVANPG